MDVQRIMAGSKSITSINFCFNYHESFSSDKSAKVFSLKSIDRSEFGP